MKQCHLQQIVVQPVPTLSAVHSRVEDAVDEERALNAEHLEKGAELCAAAVRITKNHASVDVSHANAREYVGVIAVAGELADKEVEVKFHRVLVLDMDWLLMPALG